MINTLVKQIEEKGYVVSLHHVDTVKRNYDCTEEKAREVLEDAIYTHLDNISDTIHEVAESMELKKYDYIYSELLDVFLKLYTMKTRNEVEHDLGISDSVNIYSDSSYEVWLKYDGYGIKVTVYKKYNTKSDDIISENTYMLTDNNYTKLIDKIYNELPEVAKWRT